VCVLGGDRVLKGGEKRRKDVFLRGGRSLTLALNFSKNSKNILLLVK
jgi:hypothetical protein